MAKKLATLGAVVLMALSSACANVPKRRATNAEAYNPINNRPDFITTPIQENCSSIKTNIDYNYNGPPVFAPLIYIGGAVLGTVHGTLCFIHDTACWPLKESEELFLERTEDKEAQRERSYSTIF